MIFQKKQIRVSAIKWEGGSYDCLDNFCGLNWGRADAHDVDWSGKPDKEKVVLWNTKERQWLLCPVGWWVIRGIDGELYPCEPDVFARTYEEMGEI